MRAEVDDAFLPRDNRHRLHQQSPHIEKPHRPFAVRLRSKHWRMPAGLAQLAHIHQHQFPWFHGESRKTCLTQLYSQLQDYLV
jgi:hypothetical protein